MNETAVQKNKLFSWPILGIGLLLIVLATAAMAPFMFTLAGLADMTVTAVDVLQNMVVSGLLVAAFLLVGMYLAGRWGRGFRLTAALLRREPVGRRALTTLQMGIVVAVVGVVGVLVVGVLMVLTAVALGADVTTLVDAETVALMENYPPLWEWALISFNAGVTEEIVFRLGLLTLLAALGGLVWRDENGVPKAGVFWTANFLSALAFAVAHLFGGMPYAAVPAIIARIIVQNTLLGMVFGWLFWRCSLESAMLAHFLFDIVYYVVVMPVLQAQSLLWGGLALVVLVGIFVWAWRGARRNRAQIVLPAQPRLKPT